MRLRRCVSWTARGDEDVDAKRFETVDRKTRYVPREERTRGYDWDRSADHIRARSQNGCIERPDTWLHPYRFAKGQILFPCTAGAVHTWQILLQKSFSTADQNFS